MKALLGAAWPPHCCKYRSHLKLEAFFPVYTSTYINSKVSHHSGNSPIIVFTSQLALVLCPLLRPHPLMGNMSGEHWALSELYQVSSTISMPAWCCDIALFYHVSNRECAGGQWGTLVTAAGCIFYYQLCKNLERPETLFIVIGWDLGTRAI